MLGLGTVATRDRGTIYNSVITTSSGRQCQCWRACRCPAPCVGGAGGGGSWALPQCRSLGAWPACRFAYALAYPLLWARGLSLEPCKGGQRRHSWIEERIIPVCPACCAYRPEMTRAAYCWHASAAQHNTCVPSLPKPQLATCHVVKHLGSVVLECPTRGHRSYLHLRGSFSQHSDYGPQDRSADVLRRLAPRSAVLLLVLAQLNRTIVRRHCRPPQHSRTAKLH